MLHELQQGLHRRGLKRLNKRVYTPTAIFDPEPTTTSTPLDPALDPNPRYVGESVVSADIEVAHITCSGASYAQLIRYETTTEVESASYNVYYLPYIPPLCCNTACIGASISSMSTRTDNSLAGFPGVTATSPTTTPAAIPATTTTATPATGPLTTTTPPTTTALATPTISSPTTTAPTTTALATPTTPTTTAPATTTSAPSTPTLKDVTTEVDVTITASKSQSPSISALAASPTASTEPTQTSTGVVVGGIIAAVVAVAGLVFLITYFVRRSRSAKEEDSSDDDFNPNAWKRQSTMLPDDGSSGIPRAMNYSRNGARPPTMIEQKLAGGMSFNAPPPMPSHPYGATGYGSFSPGQVVTPYTPYTPTTTNSANPFFSPYGESPIGSPVSVPAYESAYDAQGNLVSRHPSMASTAVLSRHTSVASKQEPAADGQYVEMNRSSVTPFQAAQYAEISRRLNSTPPQPLPLTAVSEEMEHAQEIDVPAQGHVEPLELQPSTSLVEGHRLNVQPTPREHSFPESPFADPNMIAEQNQYIPRRDSTDSMLQVPEPMKARVTSIPPTLPEIHLQERAFSPVAMDFPVAPSSVRPSPSPFSTSFNLPSPPANAHFHEAAEPAPVPRATARVPAVKRPETVYTLYDEEDAYAGI
ncbi:hypothetical protein C8Q80DRAFT_1125486 [Daedaleopsis nitida]|nr:hypothetical protein C8Q80DRAFT_1125486 [Daedaleopsis nitida]